MSKYKRKIREGICCVVRVLDFHTEISDSVPAVHF